MSKQKKPTSLSSKHLLQEDLWPSPVGTALKHRWVTRSGLVVDAPTPSDVRSNNGLTYAYVGSVVSITWPVSTHLAILRFYSGTGAPSVRLLSVSGTFVGHGTSTAVTPPYTYQAALQFPTAFARAEITWPGIQGEGGLVDVTYEVDEQALLASTAKADPIDEETCAGIVFAETSVLSGTGSAGATALSNARKFIAGVAYKRNGQGVAKPVIPSEEDQKNPNTRAIWERCQKAARDANDEDVKTCQHFVIWYSDDDGKTPSKQPKMGADWPYTQVAKIKESWGPFSSPIAPQLLPIRSISVIFELGPFSPVTNLHVFRYCGVT